MILSCPTLVERRTNAQFTESAVACHSVSYPPPPPSALIVDALPNLLGTLQRAAPFTTSSGEYPSFSAVARVITFHVDPG